MKAIIRFILIRYLESSRPGREEKKPTIIKTMPSSLARVLCYSSLDRAAQTLPDHQQSFTQQHHCSLQVPQLHLQLLQHRNSSKARAAGLLHRAMSNSASAPQEVLQFLEKVAEAF